MRAKIILIATALLSLGTSIAAQNQPLAFEVASVKPAAPSNGSVMVGCHVPGARLDVIPKGMCIARNATLRSILAEAYDFSVFMNDIGNYVIGGPGWIGSDRFDIEGKADNPSATTKELRAMLINLLEERFKLTIHEETKDTAGFALVIGKNGPKLTATTGDKPVSIYALGQPPSELDGQNAPMAGLTAYFERRLHHPFVDRTGLTGRYDFKIELLTDDPPHGLNESDLPAIAKALEGLGLRLQPEKLLVRRIFIDHAERPDAN